MASLKLAKIAGLITICLANGAVSQEIPRMPPMEKADKPPTSRLACNLIDAQQHTYQVMLLSGWHPENAGEGVKVISDETGVLPVGEILRSRQHAFNGPQQNVNAALGWGWRDAGFEARNKAGGLLYRLTVSRNGEQGPLSATGKLASISIIYWRKIEGTRGGEGMLDQYLGFCSVDPANQIIPPDAQRPKPID
ncbi:hypothetical protein LWE61_20070 [Sphingobium sufflavum]|uniref:hypothetical protein n=1 Tax=Sphingobium sufflavum TaxID=1129547 RepID=UPI001F3B8B36|nr:hypothetical protein [Sphingobium sufflavum]MCE7798829.1 hypothetical protein [Sphingobium sufflavum]